MNKISKRLTALVLCIIILLPILPVEIALANNQLPITDLKLANFTNALTSNAIYEIEFEWTKTGVSAVSNGWEDYETVGGSPVVYYDLHSYNASRGSAYPAEATQKDIIQPTENPKKKLSLPLDENSIYKFKIVPYHKERQLNSITGIYDTRNSPLADSSTKEALYLTDLTFNSTGQSSSITVQWTNPTVDGSNVFTSYRFYYAKGGGNVTDEELKTAKYAEVRVDDPTIQKNGNVFTYTFTDPNLVPASPYAIKIVPMIGQTNAIDRQITVTVGGKSYELIASQRQTRNNDLYVEPRLELNKYGSDSIKFDWDKFSSPNSQLRKVEVLSSPNEDMVGNVAIYTINGTAAEQITSWITRRPTGIMYYQVVYHYTTGTDPTVYTMVTNIVQYNPEKEDYYPTAPIILNVKDPNPPVSPVSLDITWEAFVRKAYDANELAVADANGYIVDRNVLYYLYVTDDPQAIDDSAMEAVMSGNPIDALSLDLGTYPDSQYGDPEENFTTPAYRRNVTQYVSWDAETGQYILKNIVDNKIYYVKIVVIRPNDDVSNKAYYAHYVMPRQELSTRPVMVSKPPLRAGDITKNSITVEWDRMWYEIYNEKDRTWYSEVGISDTGELVFGSKITDDMRATEKQDATNKKYFNLSGSSFDPAIFRQTDHGISDVKAALSASGIDMSMIPIRFMDLADSLYKIHVVPYGQMGDYDTYYQTMFLDEMGNITGDNWAGPITPQTSGGGITFSYVVNGLEPNTPYTIILMPYKEPGYYAWYPNYIVSTTLTDRPGLEITPTVPKIEAVGKTDTTVTVRFEYSELLKYTLFYSENMADYKENGIPIANDTILAGGIKETIAGKTWMKFTITNLFPDTDYHVWVQAYTDYSQSDYSNFVTLHTDDIYAPKPPDGLGLAYKGHVDIYNRTNSTTYTPSAPDYLIVEWFRDMQDKLDTSEQGILQISDVEVLLDAGLTETYMLKYNNLIANRGYYFRAKTIKTITKTDEGIKTYYQYVVQMSMYEDFTDYIEITIPLELDGLHEIYTISKESGWCDTVKLMSATSQGEYDSDKSPDTYPLPKQDFEITYNATTDTLTYRFRSNGTDAAGNKDNMVDQRFISALIANKAYNVLVDVSSYENKPVKNKVVEIPYSIVNTLRERKITLSIRSGDMKFTFAPGFVETSEVKSLRDYGVSSKITIRFSETTTGMPAMAEGAAYATNPQKMTIAVSTLSKTVYLTKTENEYTAAMKISNRYTVADRNLGAYSYTNNDADWMRINNATFESKTAEMKFTGQKVASFAAISQALPRTNIERVVTEPMNTVGTYMNITDMKTYDPKAKANSNQINKVLVALANGSKDIALNAPVTSEEQATLTKAELVVYGWDTVTRETAIKSFVKLYEIKTRSPVKNYPSLSKTPYEDIKTATKAYQEAMLKAADIGFFGTEYVSRPKDILTLGELFEFADIIILDAGL